MSVRSSEFIPGDNEVGSWSGSIGVVPPDPYSTSTPSNRKGKNEGDSSAMTGSQQQQQGTPPKLTIYTAETMHELSSSPKGSPYLPPLHGRGTAGQGGIASWMLVNGSADIGMLLSSDSSLRPLIYDWSR